MGFFRRTLVWFCCTLLVASGLFGQGVVLCLPRGEAARLEVSGDDGRCVGNRQNSSPVRFEVSSSDHDQAGPNETPAHEHGCEDVELAESLARSPVGDTDALKTAPVILVAGVPPRRDASGLRALQPSKHFWPPAPAFRDVLAVRTTVSLLI